MNVKGYYENLKKTFPDIDSWLYESITHEFGENNADKVQVLITLNNSNLAWENYFMFEKVAIILNDRELLSSIRQELSPMEVAYAAIWLKKEFPERVLEDEVLKYIADIFVNDGLIIAPSTLQVLEKYLPILSLTKEQREVQRAHLRQIETYINFRKENEVL